MTPQREEEEEKGRKGDTTADITMKATCRNVFAPTPILATRRALTNEGLAASGRVAGLNSLYQDFYYRKKKQKAR
jgi:hypothetical protein